MFFYFSSFNMVSEQAIDEIIEGQTLVGNLIEETIVLAVTAMDEWFRRLQTTPTILNSTFSLVHSPLCATHAVVLSSSEIHSRHMCHRQRPPNLPISFRKSRPTHPCHPCLHLLSLMRLLCVASCSAIYLY